jgi:hypothetical protein
MSWAFINREGKVQTKDGDPVAPARLNTCAHCGKYDWACPLAVAYNALQDGLKDSNYQRMYSALAKARTAMAHLMRW